MFNLAEFIKTSLFLSSAIWKTLSDNLPLLLLNRDSSLLPFLKDFLAVGMHWDCASIWQAQSALPVKFNSPFVLHLSKHHLFKIPFCKMNTQWSIFSLLLIQMLMLQDRSINLRFRARCLMQIRTKFKAASALGTSQPGLWKCCGQHLRIWSLHHSNLSPVYTEVAEVQDADKALYFQYWGTL